MNILLILHQKLDPNSGSAGSTLSIGRQYEHLGHRVIYFSTDDLPETFSHVTKKILFPFYVAKYLHNLFRRERIDVIDSSPCDTWLWLRFTNLLSLKRPLMVTRSHGLFCFDQVQYRADEKLGNAKLSWKYPLYHGSIRIWEEQYTLRNSDMVYMLNSQEKEYVIDTLQIDSKKVHVFPNGMPLSFVKLPFESTPFEEGAVIRIAQIGTFIQRKGIDYSIPAINNILKQYSNVEISFIGTELNGYGTESVVYSGIDASVRDRVHVVTYYQHKLLPSLLEGHHIKLFPTLSEGFGKALVEAMACGASKNRTVY